MQPSLQRQTHKQAKEEKNCMKVRNGNEFEQNRIKLSKCQTKLENQTSHSFVLLNKEKTFGKLVGKKLESIEELRSQGFFYNVYLF